MTMWKQALPLLFLRLIPGILFFVHGFAKLFVRQTETVDYFAALGFPAAKFFALGIGVLEFGGGILLAAGLLTRYVAVLFAAQMLVATLVAELPHGIMSPGAQLTIMLFTVMLALVFLGGGSWAAETRLPRKRATTTILLLTISSLLLAAHTVLAAGGGGGGGGGSAPPPPPPCTLADWQCGDWSRCTIDGEQTRTCTTVRTCTQTGGEKPGQTRSCAPECTADTWTCGEWSACTPTGIQFRGCDKTFDCPLIETSPPFVNQPCTPASATPSTPSTPSKPPAAPPCATDIWSCNDWSVCNKSGQQTRNCALTKDCPGVSTPKPVVSRTCEGLKCGHLTTIRERVRCRLQLTPGEFTQELSIQYAPELCRAQKEKEEWNECLQIYRNLAPCWSQADGAPRVACAKGVLGLPEDLRAAKQTCLLKTGAARPECLAEFKEQVLWLTVFRMYNLEVKAEQLLSRGAPWERVAEFDAQVEEHKIAFYGEGKTLAELKKIVQSLQTAWRLFIEDVKPKLQL